MNEYKQYNIEEEEKKYDVSNDNFVSSANLISSSKTLVIGKNKVILEPNNGLFTAYVARGVNSTGYSAVVVFDPTLGGFCQVRSNGDYGDTTINATTPGEKGQELYVKIDNDTDGSKTSTFGTPFKVTGAVAGSTAASAVLHFISDGNYFWEVSRTTGLNQ